MDFLDVNSVMYPKDPPINNCGTMIQWCFGGGYCLEKVLLFPSCFIALAVGLILGFKIKNMKNTYPSKFFYTLCFFMFGVMMMDSGLLHCVLHDEKTGGTFVMIMRLIVGVIDVGLTSNIAITFAFAGLADLGIWNYQKTFCKILTWLVWLTIFVLWIITMLSKDPGNMFLILYMKVIGISGGIWVVTQLILFIMGKVKLTKKERTYMLLAVLFGGIGLIGVVPQFGQILYLSMLFMGLFIIATKQKREEATKYFTELPE